MGYCNRTVQICENYVYFLFRVLIGLFFFLHGYQKIFVDGAALASQMGLAGWIEILVGLGVFLGIFTRLAATGGALLMLIAYFMAHASKGLNPLANGGELAALYFIAFLMLSMHGNGKWNLEQLILKKETF